MQNMDDFTSDNYQIQKIRLDNSLDLKIITSKQDKFPISQLFSCYTTTHISLLRVGF